MYGGNILQVNHLGKTLLNYRQQNKLTIRELAVQSGISASLIRQIERGRANPSLSVLTIIANTLNVPLYTLFINDVDTDSLISRKKDRKIIYRQDSAHTVQDILTPDFMRTHIKLLMMDLKPHSVTTKSYYVHEDKEELAVVMSGTTQVEMNAKEYSLQEGDVVRIPPYVKHRFLNRSNLIAHVLFVLTPKI
ncbi:DNA-binding protein [Oenococcus oeni S25]|nr:DNA-binding protein [Oenococcus oeni S22]KGH71132.1 DNA-binding protein [Oenococcus oeni S25]KGO16823.1 DNA-binding protein [Oenococcus oeni X2L]OIK63766.1 DNA-binding protein [Oenococcus oeni]OIK82900.1 DNA-binding protein [Oenococcus oeni]